MRRQRPALVVVGAVACLVACGGPVEVDDLDLAGEAAESCHALVEALPETVAGQERVDVDGHFGAAYGDPPIVVRCGVDRPDQLMTTCMQVDGIDWFFTEVEGGGAMATTVGRTPGVELGVPEAYVTSDTVLTALSKAVEENTAAGEGCS